MAEIARLAADDAARLEIRTEELKQQHYQYVEAHPELTQLLNDFMANCLLHKPSDVYDFTCRYFSEFSGVKWVTPEAAALKIQCLARGNKDRARVRTIKNRAKPLIVVGPSGVGKSVLVKKLMDAHPNKYGFSISHTTRAPREGEVDGQHYHFVDKQVFLGMVEKGQFVEHANVHGNLYGTSVNAINKVQDEGKVCILDIDVQGCKSVRRAKLNPLAVFVKPPSMMELENRLRGRDTDPEDVIVRRLANAKHEIEASKEPGLFDHVIVNDDLDLASTELSKIAQKCQAREESTKPKPKGKKGRAPPPGMDLSDFDEKKVVKMQTIARGKRDKARVKEIREQKQAAVKIQAVHRGNAERARQRQRVGAKAGTESAT